MIKLKKSLAVIFAVFFMAAPFTSMTGAGVTEEECAQPHYFVSTVNPTCTEQGYTLHVCSVCGYSYRDTFTSSLGGHDFGAWYTVTEASCTTDGLMRRDCARIGCSGTETKTIPMTTHVDVDENGLCDVCGAAIDTGIKELSPFDWLVKFFEYLRNWFRNIFD